MSESLLSHTSDPCSQSNPEEVRVTHTDFEIVVDFDQKKLLCWARHVAVVEAKDEAPSEIVLDSRDLVVRSVHVDGGEVVYATGPENHALGIALKIPLPSGKKQGDQVVVDLAWETSSDAVALQWLAPQNTARKACPFLFTQCQAIHARSMAPVQDTPGAKFTYTAVVGIQGDSGQGELTALMSALRVEDVTNEQSQLFKMPHENLDNVSKRFSSIDCSCSKLFRFVQPLPLSSYLIALAVGNLVGRDLDRRSRVWAEPETIDAAAFEFAETPRFVDVAEDIAGLYRWHRYDLLVLPPAFPYGGMENVNLTFVTPTLLAGDRSLVNVVAHEAAHSWTGNLVTNANWGSFFLNEGWTVWLERRILGELRGELMFQFHATLGWIQLKRTVEDWGPDHPYTQLVPEFSFGVDPDEAFSKIPYEKGFALLVYLERLVGGKEKFMAFFKEYVLRFANEPVTAESFKKYFCEYFEKQKCSGMREIDWDAWYFGRGMPPVRIEYDMTLAEKSFGLAEAWHRCDPASNENDQGTRMDEGYLADDLNSWSSEQIVAFLDRLGELYSTAPMDLKTLEAMKTKYKNVLQETHNAEIRCSWYLLRIRAGDASVLPEVDSFLSEQGRMKYLRPLYKAIFSQTTGFDPEGKTQARDLFAKHKGLYHPIAAKMVASDLGVDET